MYYKKKQGFTLIELLVVIAIIGILSSVVLASLNSARQKSRDARRISDIGQIQLALELYFDSNRSYPLTVFALTPEFLSVEPKDPVDNDSYRYAAIGAGSVCMGYHLGADLEDKEHATFVADADSNTTSGFTFCTGSSGFDASADSTDGIYDVRP